MKKTILLIFLIIFGGVTLFMSSSVLFAWFGIREKEGHFIPFVVWANWICGMLYLIAALGILRNQSWAKLLLIISLVILILTYFGLFIQINDNVPYETKTIGAMTFRIAVTALFIFLTNKIDKK